MKIDCILHRKKFSGALSRALCRQAVALQLALIFFTSPGGPSNLFAQRYALPVSGHPAARAIYAAAVSAIPARTQKLPAPDKIVNDHLKAIGGRKRIAAVRDAVYEWIVRQRGADAGTARTHWKAPASLRTDIILTTGGGDLEMASNGRSAWVRERDGKLRTLTDAEAFAAKLYALLEASQMIDYKKQSVLARTAAAEEVGGETAYRVEFSTRAGARLNYWFGASSKLLLQVRDDASGLTMRFADYRPRGATGSAPLEPHRIEWERKGTGALTWILQDAIYNTGINDALFDPPGEQSLDVPALLREVGRNQRELDERVSDYTFTLREVEREINDRGEVQKETVTVKEVYPAPGGGAVYKLVSENGVALSPEKQEREARRVAAELNKLERENVKRKQRRERERVEREAKKKKHSAGGSADEDLGGIAAFLRVCEFISPRRERFRDRDAIVFDFRPRLDFKPANDAEDIIAKLVGTVWIDPVDKQVMRLEARLDRNFKIGGGIVASVRPGSSFAFEQTRMADGVWLPRFAHISAAARLFLFAGMRFDGTRAYSDYKRFSTNTIDATLDAPKPREL